MQDLLTAIIVISSCGLNPAGGGDTHFEHRSLLPRVNQNTGGPMAEIAYHCKVLREAPSILKVTSEEVHEVTIILLPDPFLISHRALSMTLQS